MGLTHALGTCACAEAAEALQIAKGLTAMAPARVVWKLAEQDLRLAGLTSSTVQAQVGSNVKIVSWAPQNDLWGHPTVRGGPSSLKQA